MNKNSSLTQLTRSILVRLFGKVGSIALMAFAILWGDSAWANPTVTRTSGSVFYVETTATPYMRGNYISYKIQNDGTPRSNVWVKLNMPAYSASGDITLAENEDGFVQLGAMAPNEAKTAFFYVYSGANLTNQGSSQSPINSHSVEVYEGNPTQSGTLKTTQSFSFTAIQDTLTTNTNTVSTIVTGPTSPELGGIVTISITNASTGNVNNDPFYLSPATFANWPANKFELFETSITLGTSLPLKDTLFFTTSNTGSYTTIFKFRAVGTTAGPTQVSPAVQIGSGQQVKHTNVSGYTSTNTTNINQIGTVGSNLQLQKLVSQSQLAAGGTVTYTLRLTNSGSQAAIVQDFMDTLPTGVTVVSGTSKFNTVAIAEPTGSGQTKTWAGTFTIPAGTSRELTFQATIPNIEGTYTNSAIAHIGNVQIDSTLLTTDNMPETANVSVGPIPVTVSGTVFNDTDRSKVKNGSEVLVNMTGLNAVLVNTTTGLVVAQTTVTNGAFSFSNVTANKNYTVQITTATATVGSAPPVITPPSNWMITGENLNGVVDSPEDGKLAVPVATSNVTSANFGINQSQTINNTPSPTSCSILGGTLSGNNLFTPLDNGTFGVENGSPNQSPATNPYPGIVSGGIYKQFDSINHGDYSYVANPVTPRNAFQHPGITDPVYGVTGRFFASDPNTSTPTLTTTLTGLTPNQFYEYSFWAANSEPNGNPNNVDVKINNQTIYSTGPLPAIATALEWKKHTVSFTNGASTSITIDLKSTQTGPGGNDFYLDNIELRDCNFTVDYGDAPPSYGNAIHTTIPTTPKVYLGTAAPDGETITPLGGDNGAGADGDDNQGNDDEDAFTTALNNIPTTGTYALNNIPVKNTSGGNVTLHAWIDFNRDGKFAAEEYQSTTVANNTSTANLSWTVPNTTISGNSYARFRITPNALAIDNVSTTDVDERSKDAVINGEVEDYQVSIGAAVRNPNLLLVKRITGINGLTTTNGGDNLAIYQDETSNPYDDNVLTSPALIPPDTDKWPILNGFPFIVGGTNGGLIKPQDSIEYTVYFLSTGDIEAKNVLFCDRVPANVTFSPDAFTNTTANPSGIARGIAVQLGSTIDYRTNAGDNDLAQYFPPGIEPSTVYPKISCGKNITTGLALPNDNGAVVVNLGNRPQATGTKTTDEAAGAYGFIRFRGLVK